MCGLAGIHRRGTKPVVKIDRLANELLLAIQKRGTDATGCLSLMDDGQLHLQKMPIPAGQFIRERSPLKRSARTVLLHTRYATVGAPEDPKNAHPVASGSIAAIHNGTIRNASSLFLQHQLPRVGTVDSEIIPALVHKNGWGDKAIRKSLSALEGGAATAIVNTKEPSEVILARLHMYPLVYAATDDVLVWASTAEAIETAWRCTYGEALPVKPTGLLEGTVLRVNGSVRRLPTLPSRPKPPIFQANRKGWSGDLQAWATANHLSSRQAKKAQRKRGTFPVAATTAPYFYYPYWEDDICLGEMVDDTEADIRDLMEDGLSRGSATTVVREARAWADDDSFLDDFERANAAILRRA